MSTLALVRDLVFSSKLSATARALGIDLQLIRDPRKLQAIDGEKLVVDLNQPEHLGVAVAWKARTGKPVVGFIAHVARDEIEQARALGIDRVMSNGAFSASVGQVLSSG